MVTASKGQLWDYKNGVKYFLKEYSLFYSSAFSQEICFVFNLGGI
jgi:hypothetical protein